MRFGLKCGSSDQFGFEPGVGRAHILFPYHHTSTEYGADTKDSIQSPLSIVSSPNHGMLSKSAMEGPTKCDGRCSKTSIEDSRLYSHMKLLEDQDKTVCAASALQSEVVQAWLRIQKLEAEQLSSKKKVKHLLRKLGEEKASWKRREHHIRAVIIDLKHELSMERKDRQRMEILNSKLVKEAAEANLSAKQFMQDYEEERKAKDLMEEICNELAKKIGEDKAEVEALKRETMKHCEEEEEERKMLQMATVWREESVQMKLVDAKLALEDKYSQMNKLVTDLETFLRSRSNTLNVMELRKDEFIRQAVKSLNIQDMKEFKYVSSKSGDIYSIFEEIQQTGGSEKHIEACVNSSPTGGASNYHPVSREGKDCDYNNLEPKHSNGLTSHDSGLEENARGWEKVSYIEDQGSCYSLKGRDPFVNWVSRGKNVLKGGTKCNKSTCKDSPNIDFSEVCSTKAEQSKHKSSCVISIRDHPFKIISDEDNGRLSNRKISSVGTTSHRKSAEGDLKHLDLLEHWSSLDSVNPHITRGKGALNGHNASKRIV